MYSTDFERLESLIDRKKRRQVKPHYCGCARQATKEIRGLVIAREPFIEPHRVCERHYKERFNEEAEKEVQEFLSGGEEAVRKAKEEHRKNLRMIAGIINSQAEKESEDVVMTEDGWVHKAKFDKKKIH